MRNFLTGLIVLGVILCVMILQINLLNRVPLWGVKANLGIILVVTLSTLCGQGIGTAIGGTVGAFSDILFGKSFGMYLLLYLGIGFFCGKMSKGFSKENKTAIVFITAIVTVVLESLSYFLLVLIDAYEVEFFAIVKTILLESVYHMFIARIFFGLLSGLAETINKGKKSYYLL